MVVSSMIRMLLSPACCWSACSAGPPVTKTLTPGGGDRPLTIFWTASTESLPSVSPMFPASATCT